MFDRKEYNKQWAKDNPEKIKEYNKRSYLKNIESKKEYDKSPKVKERRRKRLIKSKYGLSYKEWEGLWYAQDGHCSICDKFIAETKDICIDHDHKTGKIRGLLCKECNLGIGCFFDNPKLMEKATIYLSRGHKLGHQVFATSR